MDSLEVAKKTEQTAPVLAPDERHIFFFRSWTAGETDANFEDVGRVVPVVVGHRVGV